MLVLLVSDTYEKMIYKKFAFYQWILIILLLLSCSRTESKGLVNDYTELRVLSVKELYPQAEKAALEWQEDAYLDMVTLNLVPVTDTINSSASFFFRSYAFPEIYFTYRFTQNVSAKITQLEGEFTNPKPPSLEIDPETLSLDSLDALRIMFDELGKEIYTDCSLGDWPDSLGLEQRFLGLEELTWSASFNCASPQKGGAIIISAETGEVLEIRK